MRADDKLLIRTLALLAALVVCAGCGQKGPLRLPDAPPDATGAPKTNAPADGADPTTLSARRSNPHE
jgi:predicted small lipoprotein YifL